MPKPLFMLARILARSLLRYAPRRVYGLKRFVYTQPCSLTGTRLPSTTNTKQLSELCVKMEKDRRDHHNRYLTICDFIDPRRVAETNKGQIIWSFTHAQRQAIQHTISQLTEKYLDIALLKANKSKLAGVPIFTTDLTRDALNRENRMTREKLLLEFIIKIDDVVFWRHPK